MNRTIRAALSAASLATLLTACVIPATFTRTSDAPAGHRAPEQVQIFTAGPPQQPYLERGVIAVELNDPRYQARTNIEGLIFTLRDAAAENGCDAIVALSPLAANSSRGGTATCIVFK